MSNRLSRASRSGVWQTVRHEDTFCAHRLGDFKIVQSISDQNGLIGLAIETTDPLSPTLYFAAGVDIIGSTKTKKVIRQTEVTDASLERSRSAADKTECVSPRALSRQDLRSLLVQRTLLSQRAS